MSSRSFTPVAFVAAFLLLPLLPETGHAAWVLQDSGTTANLYAVQFLDAENGYAVGDDGTVLRTSDGGSEWGDVSLTSSYPAQDLSMVDVTTGWVAVGDPNNSELSGAVWHTTDGGASWTQQPLNSTRARLGVSFVSATTGWACGANNGPMDIEATIDGGETWISQTSSNIFGWTYGIDAVSTSLVWSCGVVYYPAATGFVVHTTDGGAQWSMQNTGTVPFTYGIDFASATVGFTAGEDGSILATDNGGTSWAAQATGISSDLMDVSCADPMNGAACGAGGTIITTTDGGQVWIVEATPTTAALNGVFVLDATHAWAVGDNGTIVKLEVTSTVEERSPYTAVAWLRSCPNPIVHQTTVSYVLTDEVSLRLAVFDPVGRQVAFLADGMQSAGEHRVYWDGRDHSGRRLASGTYLLLLRAGGSDVACLPVFLVR